MFNPMSTCTKGATRGKHMKKTLCAVDLFVCLPQGNFTWFPIDDDIYVIPNVGGHRNYPPVN
jgi:hypothetical protein